MTQAPSMDASFHYPPEVLNLLVDTIPLLCRSKSDTVVFFLGAGVPQSVLADLQQRVLEQSSINKYEIVRTVLVRLNQQGDRGLRERREIVRRVEEFEDFSSCWPDDQLKAQGLVAEFRRVRNVKDSFTRMRDEQENERQLRQQEQRKKQLALEKQKSELGFVQADLYALFKEPDSHKRGKALEGVLNRLFGIGGILVKESFTLTGQSGEGIVEQVDGAVEIDGQVYLTEMKWWQEPLGVQEVSAHLVRVFNRGYARGIFISSSRYTDPAITTCRESLQRTVVVLCTLQEIVLVLERNDELIDFFREKIRQAVINRNPFFEIAN